ncbi:MAG: sporulation protein [Actinomycetes bacterium]
MKVEEVLSSAREAMRAKRVFAEPYEKNGVTVIAAANVAGGGGGGGGHDQNAEGSGVGFGVAARPAGAYVIRDGKVSWRPAVDVNRLIGTLGAVAIAYLLSRARIERSRARRARRR